MKTSNDVLHPVIARQKRRILLVSATLAKSRRLFPGPWDDLARPRAGEQVERGTEPCTGYQRSCVFRTFYPAIWPAVYRSQTTGERGVPLERAGRGPLCALALCPSCTRGGSLCLSLDATKLSSLARPSPRSSVGQASPRGRRGPC